MATKRFTQIKYTIALFLAVSFLVGCPPAEVPITPFSDEAKRQIDFSFSDTDPEQNQLAGELTLDIPSNLIPAAVTQFVIYWSSSEDAAGQGPMLAEVSSSFSGPTLYTVPDNTAIPAGMGDSFLLYLKGANGQEVYSGLAASIDDLYVPPAEEPTVVEEDQPVMEEAKEEPVQQQVQEETPMDQPEDEGPVVEKETTDTGVPVIVPETETPDVVEETPDVVEETPEVVEETADVVKEPTEITPLVIVVRNALFEFDKSYLRPEFKEQLREDFADVEEKQNMELLIAGHADERGSNEYNLALGERRAWAVKRYLVSMGFAAENLRIISYGEEKPVDPGHNEEAWRKNRRAETKVIE